VSITHPLKLAIAFKHTMITHC